MVMVGSALLVAVGGIGAGFTVSFTKQFSSLAPNIIFIHNSKLNPDGSNTLTPTPPKIVVSASVAKTIASLPAVRDAIPHFRVSVIAKTPSETRTEALVSMDLKKSKSLLQQ